jgi:hypothetical protein
MQLDTTVFQNIFQGYNGAAGDIRKKGFGWFGTWVWLGTDIT